MEYWSAPLFLAGSITDLGRGGFLFVSHTICWGTTDEIILLRKFKSHQVPNFSSLRASPLLKFMYSGFEPGEEQIERKYRGQKKESEPLWNSFFPGHTSFLVLDDIKSISPVFFYFLQVSHCDFVLVSGQVPKKDIETLQRKENA